MITSLVLVAWLFLAAAPAEEAADPAARWASVRNRIDMLLSEGRTQECMQVLEQSIVAARKVGDGGPEVARALNDLGSLYQDLYRLVEADRCYAEAIRICKAHREPAPSLIVLFGNLAGLRVTQGRYAEAERLFRDAERLSSGASTADSPALSSIYLGLAEIAFKTKRYGDALRFAERTLVSVQNSADSENRGGALFLMARIAAARRRTAEAEGLMERALDAWKPSIGVNHPTYASGLAGLGLLRSAKRPGDAERLFREALRIAEAKFGTSHPYYAQIMLQYSSHLDSHGHRKEADGLRQNAEKILSDQALRNRLGFSVDIKTPRSP